MNLTLQQALKYGTREDLLASLLSTHANHLDPTHMLVAADAVEESGEEGAADLLRAVAKQDATLVLDPEYYDAEYAPPFTTGMGSGVGGWLTVAKKTDDSGDKKLNLRVVIEARPVHPAQRRRRETGRLLTPQEAKEATARLPNASEIHQFIDHHFPEQKPESEAN